MALDLFAIQMSLLWKQVRTLGIFILMDIITNKQ